MRRKKRRDFYEANRRNKRRGYLILFASLFVILAAGSATFYTMHYYKQGKQNSPFVKNGETDPEQTNLPETIEASTTTTISEVLKKDDSRKALLKQAEELTTGYDYDGAISLLKQNEGYEKFDDILAAINQYEDAQTKLVEWDINDTTHIFFHSLIVDTKKAFDKDERENGYDMYMTTISEFNKMMESMYKRGYVLVTPYQMSKREKNKRGKEEMVEQSILLPKGKKAFVLSVDDVSYYQYMNGDGFASRLIIDENGDIKNEMDMEDGSTQIGDFDVAPLLERFLEKHPDFSYKGARGILALTGYDGVLGYRTSESQHKNNEQFVKDHPDYNFEEECKKAKAVVAGLKAKGWMFASHSYSHNNIGQQATGDKKPMSYKNFVHDTDMWEKEVESILGETDIIIFPQGTYLNEQGRPDWKPYLKSNTHYKYLRKKGFRYYFGVGGYQPWVQSTNDYLRQDRINFDGVEMRNSPQLLKPFFNPAKVYDKSRPTKLK